MIYNDLNRVKRILSAQQGAQVLKFEPGGSFVDPEYQEWCAKSGVRPNPMTLEEFKALKKLNPTGTVQDLINYSTGQVALPNGQNYADFASSVRNQGQSNVQVNGNEINQGNSAIYTKIPGGIEATPYTVAENAARQNERSKQIVDEMTAKRQAQAIELPEVTATSKISNQTPTLNVQPVSNKITQEEISSGIQGMKQNLDTIDQDKAEKAQKWGQVGQIASQGIQMIGNAFAAKQSATDSDTTKTIDSVYNGAADIASSFGPVGQAIGTGMKIMGAAGNILQELGSGTDQMTKTDQWMDSALFSWNIGALNGALGKNSNSFGVDQSIIESVGSSYGGSVNDMMEAEKTAGKKYGLFSSGARKKANAAIAKAAAKQNLMGDISDDATDQRLAAQSMGEQAGLAYSLMTDGGYNQKYTYAAKHGGLLEQNPIIELELEPKIELNWELPVLKKGGNVDINEELEWIPEFKDGNKLDFDTWFNSIPEEYRANGYDYKKAYEVFDWDLLSKHAKDPENNHLGSVSPVADENGNFPFLKLGKLDENKELQGEFDWYNSDEGKEHRNKFDIKFIDGRYYYVPKQLKQGGSVGDSDIPEIEETTQKNVIPEGALHKNKHHMEHAEGLTKKGIPVIDDDGEQQAEIEHSEIIFTLEVTKKLEEYYGIFYSEKSTNKEKEQAALDAGKLLVYQILENTEDRTGLIESCKKGGTLVFKKDTEDLIEEVLEWTPTVVVIEKQEESTKEKPNKKQADDSKKELKQMIKEALVEILIK